MAEEQVEKNQLAALKEEFKQRKDKGEFEKKAAEIKRVAREKRRGMVLFTDAQMEKQMRPTFEHHLKQMKRGHRIGDRLASPQVRRFEKWVRKLVVDQMASSIAATFYACDYSTKPNMTCAPLLVAIRE